MTKLEQIMEGTRDALTVRRVFGEPYETNGVTVIPAAAVRGGGGGGEGEGETAETSGVGGGFGMSARPIGAYEIHGEQVRWVPAADTTRVILLAEILAIVALFVIRSIVRRADRCPEPS